jgi:hypothetical protein
MIEHVIAIQAPSHLSLPTMSKRVATTHFEILRGGCYAEVYLVADIRGSIRGSMNGERSSCRHKGTLYIYIVLGDEWSA